MKIKRYKRVRRFLNFYKHNFGISHPYKIVTDGTFCKAALDNKINLREQMPNYFGDLECQFFVTQCTLKELEALGQPCRGALGIAKGYKRAEKIGMKEVALGSHAQLNFPHVCSCLLVADVDNDGITEVVAGSRDGHLAIFKPGDDLDGQPFRNSSKLGLITALACGDLFNRNRPVLSVISADGACHVFRVSQGRSQLQLCLTQPLQSNIKAAGIVDVDGDLCQELVVALSDRVVRTYRYVSNGDSDHVGGHLAALNKWESPALITAYSHVFAPSGGVQIVLSQRARRFVVLEPKLGTELELAGEPNTPDRSVRYCQASDDGFNASFEAGNLQHVKPEDDIDSIFLAENAEITSLFHQPSSRILLVDRGMANIVRNVVQLPSKVFAISSLVYSSESKEFDVSQVKRPANGSTDLCEHVKHQPYGFNVEVKRLFLACDWQGNIYGFDPANRKPLIGSRPSDLLLMQMNVGNLNCFTAATGKTELYECMPKCIFATSTTRGGLFVSTVPLPKIENFLTYL